jgi:hypothetical protein
LIAVTKKLDREATSGICEAKEGWKEMEGYVKMSFLKRIFGKKSLDQAAESPQQAVLVHLDTVGLPDHIYQDYDLATIEDKLIEVIEREGLGEFDGNEVGPGETTLFIYGPDAERLFAGIEQTLRGCPLCQGARVEIRCGGPGAQQRELRL